MKSPRRKHKGTTEKKGRSHGPKIHAGTGIKRDTKTLQEAFLAAYRDNGTISGACRVSDVGRRTHYGWLEHDPTYPARFASTHEETVDRAEEALRLRGIVGVEEPVFWKGKQTSTKRVYSDACLIFYLKGRRPEVFKERFEHAGPGGGPILTRDEGLREMSDEELSAEIDRLRDRLIAERHPVARRRQCNFSRENLPFPAKEPTKGAHQKR